LNSLAFPIEIILKEPSDLDKKADRERVLDSLSQAIDTGLPIDIDLDVLRQLPSVLRRGHYSLRVVIAVLRKRMEVVATGQTECYGLALDLGTTNLVASLVDLNTSTEIDVLEAVNPQTRVAADVLSRIHKSMMGFGGELHRLLIEGVNELIRRLCAANGIDQTQVFAVTVAGNTIMTHYFLELPVANIPMAPYIPAAHNIGIIRPSQIGVVTNPKGSLYVFPNSGSYVGGDIISGILVSGLYKAKKPSLLIDVGTNVEIVLGCDEWIIVGAGAAGPALEGDIAGIGMRAAEGAIYGFEMSGGVKSRGMVKYETVGGKEPAGICGSGMIELVSELFKNGVIDQRGKFTASPGWADRIIVDEGNKAFVMEDKGGKNLVIKETEINNFLRSKAALFASIHLLVKSVGLCFRDLGMIYVCGAFGAHINVDKAISIGMLPDIERDRFKVLGNSSLAGAEEILLNSELLSEIDRITAKITYREMNTEGDFLKEFPAAMFLPHTSPEVLRD
jgi:uncharacterized 2Fe-2S/4Fe-4S cluster protein (DUF4445 family)